MEKVLSEYFADLQVEYYYGSLIRCDRNWDSRNVVCPYSKIYYLLDGECEIVIRGVPYHGEKNSFFFIPSGVEHSFYHINENYVKKYWFHFEIRAGEKRLFQLLDIPYHIKRSDTHIVPLFERIIRCSRENTVSGILNLKTGIIEMVTDYITYTHADRPLDNTQSVVDIEVVLDFINHHLSENLTVPTLAELLHLHPNYFIPFFKKQIGMSPLKYVNFMKMERAKAMLENTAMPLCDIMERTGFTDASYFSKIFKQYSGYAPKIYREKYKGKEPANESV